MPAESRIREYASPATDGPRDMALQNDPNDFPRDIPAPEGFPDGWKSIERLYGPSSKLAGQIYVRYASIDGKHKSISSPKAVFELHCQTHPHLNSNDLMANYQLAQRELKLRREAEREKERQDRGVLTGPAREEAIERFRSRCGALSGPVVFAFPGWKARWEYQPNCGQVAVVYTDTANKEWKLLKDLECSFGNAFTKGQEAEQRIVRMVEEASARADPARFALGSRTARESQTTFTMSMDGGEKVLEAHEVLQMKIARKTKKPRLETTTTSVTSAQYNPLQTLDAVGLPQENWAASFESVEKARNALSECHRLLEAQWGPKVVVPELIAVYGVPAERKYHKRIHGVYRKLPEPVGGKACYQRLLHAPSLSCVVGCDRIYILWSETKAQWQVVVELTDSAARLAFCPMNSLTPMDASEVWQVQDAGDEFIEEPTVKVIGRQGN